MLSNDENLNNAIDACINGSLASLKKIVPKIVDPLSTIEIYDQFGIRMTKPSLIHIAVFHGSYDIVRYLLNKGADPHAIDGEIYHFHIIELLYISLF